MDRQKAIEALRIDLIKACRELTFEKLLVARNLVRALAEQQDVAPNSDMVPTSSVLAPGLASTYPSSFQTATEFRARSRKKRG
jgi:hypothetical protein